MILCPADIVWYLIPDLFVWVLSFTLFFTQCRTCTWHVGTSMLGMLWNYSVYSPRVLDWNNCFSLKINDLFNHLTNKNVVDFMLKMWTYVSGIIVPVTLGDIPCKLSQAVQGNPSTRCFDALLRLCIWPLWKRTNVKHWGFLKYVWELWNCCAPQSWCCDSHDVYDKL